MKVDIPVPQAGESVTEAVISNILAPSGSYVKVDQEIIELETEKVNQVIYAPVAGLLQLHVKKEETVKVGQVIGFIDTEAKAPAGGGEQKPAPEPAPAAPQAKKEEVPKPVAPPAAPVSKKEEPASVRKMMPEFLGSLNDKDLAPQAPAQPEKKAEKVVPGKSTRKRMSGLRKTIAQKLVEAKNNTAMLTTFNEIDMSAVISIREKEKESFQARYGVKLGFMSFFVKGVVAALKAVPEANASIEGDEIVTYHTCDIGIAVGTEKGLMVPVVRNCEDLSFGDIEKAIAEYAQKARSSKITLDDMRGGTFTITNGGTYGSLLSTPILNPPQSAILGMHAIVKRPVVVADQIVVRPMMYVALSYDHRIIDGKEAILFLVRLKEALEDPARLLLEL